MPTYRVETNQGTFDIEADREPTAADVEAILSQQKTGSVTPEEASKQGMIAAGQAAGIAAPGAGAIASMIGDPRAAAATGVRMAGPAIGQAIGVPLAPFTMGASVPTLGFAGGVGAEALASMIEGQPITKGRLTAAGITGIVPGSSLAGAGVRQIAKEGTKLALTNLAATTAQTLGDENRIPTASESAMAIGSGYAAAPLSKYMDTDTNVRKAMIEKADNAVADAVISRVSKEYNTIAPELARPDAAEKTTIALGRRFAGLAEDVPLSKSAIDGRIKELNRTYETVAGLSPDAETALELMKEARKDAKKAWRAYEAGADKGNPDPALLQSAKTNDSLAEYYENELIKEGQRLGKVKEVQAMQAAKPQLAKVHTLDRAMNYSRGVPDAKYFGMLLKNGIPLTDEGELIGMAYNSNLLGERATGSLLSRTLTISRIIADRAAKTRAGQYILTRPTPYAPMPGMAAQLYRFATMQRGQPSR